MRPLEVRESEARGMLDLSRAGRERLRAFARQPANRARHALREPWWRRFGAWLARRWRRARDAI